MKKFVVLALCAVLFSPLVDGGTNPTPDIHALVATTVAPLTITSGTPPSGRVGVQYGGFHYVLGRIFYGFPITATGGVAPYTWSATGLPPGVAPKFIFYGGSTRCCIAVEVLGGIPTKAGTYTTVLTVTDSATVKHHKSATYTIKILPHG